MGWRRCGAVLVLSASVVASSACGGTTTTVVVTAPSKPLSRGQLSFTGLVAKVRSGVIRIETTTCAGGEVGTGILVGPRLIVTVEHVVNGATSVTLSRNGKILGFGTVIGSDPARDVALVRSSSPISGYHFHFATRAPILGEDVAAIGFPFALPLTVTRGTVSGLDRTVPIDGIDRTQLVQTDAPVNPGNSGGPLMTNSGAIVGLVDLGTTAANGIAFAVDATVAGPLIQSWSISPQPAGEPSCAGQYSAAPPTMTSSSPTPPQSYAANGFSIEYPADWVVSHIREGGGNIDATFEPPGGGGLLIRADVNPDNKAATPLAAAAPVLADLRAEPSYSELSLSNETFDGLPALRWEFEDVEAGILLHKVDEFFIDSGGRGWALLIQAPQALWVEDGGALESYLQTFAFQ